MNKLETLRKVYQHLCDCQDLAESVGEWDLFSIFENLRKELNRKMYG